MPFPPHIHQERAFQRLSGAVRKNTLVATGTGSGKTECFLMPILAACEAQARTPGIKAILIYPMILLARPWKKLFDIVTDALKSLFPKPSITSPAALPRVPANFRSQRGARGDQNSPFLMHKGGLG